MQGCALSVQSGYVRLPHPTYVHELQRSAGGVRWPRVKAILAVRLGSGGRQQPQFKT
jgi:hypothetical protein